MKITESLARIFQKIAHWEIPVILKEITILSPSQRLKDKKIVITGGGKGLGRAMAERFAAEGANVLITGRNEITLRETAQALGIKYAVFDITTISEIDNFIQNTIKKLGGIDVLVNNAGISLHENSVFDVTEAGFDKQFSTNLKAPFFLTQSYVKWLRENDKKGNVLFISSEAGETVDYRPYGFTKGAINSMVKGLANLFKLDGIRINAIAPGITATEMTGVKEDENLYAGGYGSGRFYLPQEIAETAVFLISDAANCISGQIITCNNAHTVNPRWL